MAKEQIIYRRKLSGEEAIKRFILVLHESLKLFPKPGTQFGIKIGDKKIKAELKIVENWSQGSRKPATEYQIDLSKHVALYRPHYGQIITLTQVRKNQYTLE